MSFVFNFESDFKEDDIKEIFKKFNIPKEGGKVEEDEDGLDIEEFSNMILSFA